MAELIRFDANSNLIRFVLKHLTTGDGLTGLSNTSAGLIISTIADNEATATVYTVAASNVETIATLGTYAAPTALKCRFKEVDATNHQGLYEFQFADARFSVANSRKLVVSVSGATNLLDVDYEIALVQFDPYDTVRLGLTALPTVVAGAAGGLPLTDAVTNGVNVNQAQTIGLTPTADTTGDALLNAARSLPNNTVPGLSTGLARVTDLTTTGSASLRLVNTVMQTGSNTLTLIALGTDLPSGDTNDIYNNLTVVARDVSAGTKPNIRYVSDYDATANSFALDAALDFTPEIGVDTFEIWAIAATSIGGTFLSELQKVTTGFTAANPENLNSYLKAIMSKTATVPAGMGTYNPTTDTLEVLRERIDLIEGSGFGTSTDSLQAIRDAIDTLVAPAVVTSTSVSGSGFISDCIGLVRRAVDEPSTSPKYTNADINEFIHAAYDVILSDMDVNTDHPILVRLDISVVAAKQTYNLPPNVAQLLRVAKITTATGLVQWEVWPGNEFSGHGQGYTIEGNTLRLLQDWNSSETLQLLYMPNSDVSFHKGTVASGDVTADVLASSIKFAATVTDGTLDTRPNCYAGYMVRLLSSSSGRVEERIITAYNATTRVATVNQAWDTLPVTGTAVVYEVLPQFSRLLKHVVCLRAAIDILAQEGNAKRMQTLTAAFTVKMSALRRYQSSVLARWMHSASGDTMDNLNRGSWGIV